MLSGYVHVHAYEPHCHSCKWFIPNSNALKSDYGLCSMFKNTFDTPNRGKMVIYDYAKHCRSNENQCGKTGWMFDIDEEDEDYDEIIVDEMDEMEEKEIDRLWQKYEEMHEELNGEIHEIDLEELDEIENIIRKLKRFER